jgi:hypothetical protein
VDWLDTDPTGSGDADFLIIGDLNAYAKEDPIDALKAGGYDDMVSDYVVGEDAYSYVFDGQLGYLDHALAMTNSEMAGEVSGVTIWHINADEPNLIDYDTSYKEPAQDAIYAPDAFRSSDHDPVLIGLDVCPEVDPVVQVTPDLLWPVNHKLVDVVAEFIDEFHPNSTITFISVVSSEEDEDGGDGNTDEDIIIIDDFTFQLRAERSGNSEEGRIYTITYLVTDACGKETVVTAEVVVPHDMSEKEKEQDK